MTVAEMTIEEIRDDLLKKSFTSAKGPQAAYADGVLDMYNAVKEMLGARNNEI